uniref:Acyltransferase n=1 Tax=Haematococcus lacustris TaxID=44745 RepID=A0A7G8Z0G2_HAELA|nr:acyl-CoA: diacylglycerol acyltransferase 2B [Haematococcus lacustris]QNL10739.1 acyl-CoA: diacylglycerol acyltransferase 2-2 [Haematococcus lacustris]
MGVATNATHLKETASHPLETHECNVRIWSDGQTRDSKMTWLELVVAVITLTAYTGWIHILMLLGISAVFWQVPRLILIVLLSTLLLPARPVLWTSFNRSWVFSTWRKYFKFSYLLEAPSKPGSRLVMAEFPHGVFPMGPLLAGTLCQILFPDFNIFSLAASSVFSVPGWRHFVAWMGSMPATRSNYRLLLSKGSVAVIVGGIAEMFLQHPHKQIVKLLTRKGFVEVAVEEGADGVVPVYHFGNTDVLDIFPQCMGRLSRRMRAAGGFMYGVAGLPVPRRKPIYMVTGSPIQIAKTSRNEAGFQAEVDRVHGLVVKELQALYDRHKASFGWQDKPLEIQ